MNGRSLIVSAITIAVLFLPIPGDRALAQISGVCLTDSAGRVVQSSIAGLDVHLGFVSPDVPCQTDLISTPNLIHRTKTEADKLLKDTGLSTGNVAERAFDRDFGRVIEQIPVTGTYVARGSAVNIVIAIETPIPVPNLLGKTKDEADKLLKDKGLTIGNATERASDRDIGKVIEQNPLSGKQVAKGSAVNIVIAIETPIPVPSLLGKTKDEADKLLKNKGLTIGNVAERESDRDIGKVIEQVPVPGKPVAKGSAINIVIAIETPIPVPSLLGKTRDEADKLLKDKGLTIGNVTERASDRDIGKVIAQDPVSGKQVAKGYAVDIVIAIEALIRVPSLLGKTKDEADKLLKDKGLTIGNVTERASDRDIGKVIEQVPVSGKQVANGTAVDIVMAIEKLVAVPNLMGEPKDNASAKLTTTGLQPGNIQSRYAFVFESGKVIEQFPEPYTKVSVGTAVNLTIGESPWLIIIILSGLGGLATILRLRQLIRKQAAIGPPRIKIKPVWRDGTQTVGANAPPAHSIEVRLKVAWVLKSVNVNPVGDGPLTIDAREA